MIKLYFLIVFLLVTAGCYHHRSHHHHHSHKHRQVVYSPPPKFPKYGTWYRVIINEKGEKELRRVDDEIISE